MPYKGDGEQFSIRVPRDLILRIQQHFAGRNQNHLTKNAKMLTLLQDGLDFAEWLERQQQPAHPVKGLR